MNNSTDNNGRRFFYLLIIASLLLLFLFLRSYIGIILFSALLGLFYYPIYSKMADRLGKFRGLALVATYILILITFFLPVVFTGLLLAYSARDLVSQLDIPNYSHSITLPGLIDQLNNLLSGRFGLNYTISYVEIAGKLKSLASQSGSILFGNVKSIASGIVGLIPLAFLFVYIVGAILTNYDKIKQYIHDLSPLGEEIDHLYIERIKLMAFSMIKGTFVVAFVQGIITGILLLITGIPYALALSVLAMVFSVIPLGAGIITIPAGIALLATGNIWQGILLILGQLLIISNADNVLRPKLVDKKANLHPALVLIGIIAGISSFGFMGIIYGPVLIIFFVTTFEVYVKYFKSSAVTAQ